MRSRKHDPIKGRLDGDWLGLSIGCTVCGGLIEEPWDVEINRNHPDMSANEIALIAGRMVVTHIHDKHKGDK